MDEQRPLPTLDARFDSGNGQLVDVEPGPPARLRVLIEPDRMPASSEPLGDSAPPGEQGPAPFRQWFHFRVHGEAGVPVEIVIENASLASYAGGWTDYRAVVSEDEQHWYRVDTDYVEGRLRIRHRSPTGTFACAYFAPYPLSRHAGLLARAQGHPDVQRIALGRTVDGRVLDALRVGAQDATRLPLWIIARQHPGESMAEWFVEGLLDRLLDEADPVARRLRAHHQLWIVPNMNPDGTLRGHLRTNAAGINLNRAWQEPDPVTSPEVHAVREAMLRTGVSLSLDVHGDEALPWVFTAGCEGAPGYGGEWQAAQERFRERLRVASPDYQTRHGYPVPPPGRANPVIATNWIGGHFQCPAFTLEMPFKDNAGAPDPVHGWSPERAARLGAATLGPLLAHLEDAAGAATA
ncbi:MAG: M14-type cytosolic carboxypeptidase [Pseudomonadales bacterium]|jgi:murein tripeptide amidase MpaA|nr:M14-type cytosolic carboxypeptidase [Pseudomonadales bacterium]